MDKRLISHYFHVVYRKRRVNYYPRYPICIDNAQLDISNIQVRISKNSQKKVAISRHPTPFLREKPASGGVVRCQMFSH